MELLRTIFIYTLTISLLYIKISSAEDVTIFPGVKIVESNLMNKIMSEKLSRGDFFQGTFDYLKSHELKLELSKFINGSDIEKLFKNISDHNQWDRSTEARKGNKGGLGYVLLMGGMLAKTMAALGFGGVAMLALKALGASLAALLLSSLVGLKKLGEQGHHEVQYLTTDHHRKKRNTKDI